MKPSKLDYFDLLVPEFIPKPDSSDLRRIIGTSHWFNGQINSEIILDQL